MMDFAARSAAAGLISMKVRYDMALTRSEERFVKERGVSPAAANRVRLMPLAVACACAREAAAAVRRARVAFHALVGIPRPNLSNFRAN